MNYSKRRQTGFGYIAAIVIVVILAALATAAVRMNTAQQASSSQDVLSARALQAARAGNELGLYRALVDEKCENTFLGMGDGIFVQVKCTPAKYWEGESTPGVPVEKTVYEIDAVACNSSASCPDNAMAPTPDYVERRRVVTACVRAGNSDC